MKRFPDFSRTVLRADSSRGCRGIGERSDAVLRPAMPGNDEREAWHAPAAATLFLLDLVEAINHVLRRRGRAGQQTRDFLAVDRADVEPELFRLVSKTWVAAHCHEGRLQRLGAVGRQPRRRRERQRHEEWQLGELE